MKAIRGVYGIRNKVNGNLYVGSAENIRDRWKNHKTTLRHGKHRNRHMQSAWDKYGESEFEFFILRQLTSQENILENEQEFIDRLHPEYNILRFAGSPKGHRHSEETLRKLSEAAKRQGFSGGLSKGVSRGKGRKPTEETRRKLREAVRLGLNIPKAILATQKAVNQYSKNMEFIATFVSVREAARSTNTPVTSISECCREKMKSAGGFIWRYSGESEKQSWAQ